MNIIRTDPLNMMIASASVGMYKGNAVLNLDYAEDSSAETDMNAAMNTMVWILTLEESLWVWGVCTTSRYNRSVTVFQDRPLCNPHFGKI